MNKTKVLPYCFVCAVFESFARCSARFIASPAPLFRLLNYYVTRTERSSVSYPVLPFSFIRDMLYVYVFTIRTGTYLMRLRLRR